LPFSRGMLGQELKLFEEIFLHIHHRTSWLLFFNGIVWTEIFYSIDSEEVAQSENTSICKWSLWIISYHGIVCGSSSSFSKG
jgi:hypothetical protein